GARPVPRGALGGARPRLQRGRREHAADQPDPRVARRRTPLRIAVARARRVMRELSHSEVLPVALDTEALRRVNHMSAPVFEAAGCVAIAIRVLGPTFDLTPAEIGTLGERLLATAREATARIGGRIPEPAVRTAGVAA